MDADSRRKGMALETLPLILTIPSDLRLVPMARGFVEAVCQAGGLDQATTDAVVLATSEAATNIIRHGHRNHPEASVQIQCRLGEAAIEVCLLDEGEPFNLASVPHLDPSEIRIGGRGVFLMRSLMDELNCQPRGDRGNTLRMVKHCRRNSSVAVAT
jgi:serine/threonine-protein kinase RsbW